jgi:hypothetical protein
MRTLARITHSGPTGSLLHPDLNSFLPASLLPRLPSPALVYTRYNPMLVSRLPFPSNKRNSSSVADQTKMELPSPQGVISKVPTSSKHDKRGFVFYRCTYEDDQAWERFKQVFRERTQRALQRSDTLEVADSHEWTFVDDRPALDGASRSQLRERFNNRAAHAIATEQPRAKAEIERDPMPTSGIPRYNYFIQVDDKALQSVIADPELARPFWGGICQLCGFAMEVFGRKDQSVQS